MVNPVTVVTVTQINILCRIRFRFIFKTHGNSATTSGPCFHPRCQSPYCQPRCSSKFYNFFSSQKVDPSEATFTTFLQIIKCRQPLWFIIRPPFSSLMSNWLFSRCISPVTCCNLSIMINCRVWDRMESRRNTFIIFSGINIVTIKPE